MKNFIAFAVFGALTLSAAPVAIQGSGSYGSFAGSLNYSTNLGLGLLTVSLTNTSSTANGGYITAFALNNPSNQISSVTLLTGSGLEDVLPNPPWWSPDFFSIDVNNGVAASPYAPFDFGAALGGSWLGGGSPNAGIAAGQTASFGFVFTGTNLNSLSSQSFVNALNEPGGEFLAVRFRGFNNGASDKVTGDVSAVPEPAHFAFLLVAGLGSALAMRKRRAVR